jgi:hypothetical protein
VEAKETAGEGSEDEAQRKAERRKYVLGRDHLSQAERALKEGRLAEAVGLSHRAYQTSNDGRIFRAMIEVHLRAARKRPPAIQTFQEEMQWLLCALQDDGTNDKVQEAVAKRFLAHAQQLAELGTEQAHDQAIATLQELTKHGLMPEQGRLWLQQLRAGPPGKVRLVVPEAE